ncbi:immunoglobulin-like domain-containing protein [Candidatus Enterococcus mansonii]|uniref:Bacterial Ig domain-containing protein n=1 Tax=Candidatus Enterococcus mansonii TaxID=1834181 RepID=A0A242C6W0_9ENTE|nr:immunoglobulin-like domain-containing protein [Enterococcus sp. 4G2_DIV0659]OTO05532.1 hypothetical protein A5880_002705 [Enterococcus sp. 4G2_DIV0659]
MKKKALIGLGLFLCFSLGNIAVPAATGLTALTAEATTLATATTFKNHGQAIASEAVNVGEKQDLYVSGKVDRTAGIYWVQLWVNGNLITEKKVQDNVPVGDDFFFELPIQNSIHSLEDKVKVVGLSKSKEVMDESEVKLQDGAYTLIANEFTLMKDDVVTGIADPDIADVELAVNGVVVDHQDVDFDDQFTLNAKESIHFLDDFVEVIGYDYNGKDIKHVKVSVNPIKIVMDLKYFTLGDKYVEGTVSGEGVTKVLLYVNNKRQGNPVPVNSDGSFKLSARAIRALDDDVKIATLNDKETALAHFNVLVNPAGFSRPFIGQYSDKQSAAPGENVGFQTSFRNYGFPDEFGLGTETIPTAEWIKPEFYFYYQKDMEIASFTMGNGTEWAPLVSVTELDPTKVVYTELENRTFSGTEYKGFKLTFQYNLAINSSFGGTFLSGWLKTPVNKTNDLSVIAFGSSNSKVANYKPIVHAFKDSENLTQSNDPNKLIFGHKKTNYNVAY